MIEPTPHGFVTTEGRCSNCGAKLKNAETARLNWQGEAHRLDAANKELWNRIKLLQEAIKRLKK